jgi:hypothetical protein
LEINVSIYLEGGKYRNFPPLRFDSPLLKISQVSIESSTQLLEHAWFTPAGEAVVDTLIIIH